MSLLERLKEKNRTVLEVDLGIIACGILLQIAALCFASDRLTACGGFLLGSVLAMISIGHMYRVLDRALDFDEGTAQKLIYRGYITRYFALAAILLFLIATKLLNPLVVFGGYMTMKAAVYLQPLTHKLCNRIFHETDPEPISEEEYQLLQEQMKTASGPGNDPISELQKTDKGGEK